MKVREYRNYNEYIKHQANKLGRSINAIRKKDIWVEKTVSKRYKGLFDFRGKSVLCLAARLGGEVRAFKKMGGVAIGIDINPGVANEDVLYGDFHNLSFPDNSFDYLFTNSIDHVLNLDSFLYESNRVLKGDGVFILEIKIQKAGKYEVIDTMNINPIVEIIKNKFVIVDEITNIPDWKILILRKNGNNKG